MITILTRSGNRPNDFKTLVTSINKQTIKPPHFISNDNPKCTFLSKEKHVFPVIPERDKGEAFYNIYLNELVSKVTEGWILILDDDSKLIDNEFIEKLSKLCEETYNNQVIIFQSFLGKEKRILPNDYRMKNRIIEKGQIDMGCFCVHVSCLKQVKFDGRIGGDYNILVKLKQKGFCFKFVEKLPIGIWANYQGNKGGKNI